MGKNQLRCSNLVNLLFFLASVNRENSILQIYTKNWADLKLIEFYKRQIISKFELIKCKQQKSHDKNVLLSKLCICTCIVSS